VRRPSAAFAGQHPIQFAIDLQLATPISLAPWL